MDAPALVLVPPTPVKYNPTPSPSSATTSGTTSSSLPQSRFSKVEQERTSSETTIFSIYSMYGDEQPHRGSWSASGPSPHDRRPKDISSIPTVDLTLPDTNSFFKSSGHAQSDLGWYDSETPKAPPPTRTTALARAAIVAANGTSTIHGTSRSSQIGPRPASSYTTASSVCAHLDSSEDRRVSSTGHSYRTSDLTGSSSAAGPSRSRQSSTGTSQTSRRSSRSVLSPRDRQSDTSIRELPPLPTPTQTTPYSTPPRQLSPNPPPQSAPPALPLKHPTYMNSPTSKTSLVPSEGEDMDAFHVRNTYAQLEMSGVKGDGYEEGVERTRARIGASRMSQLNALAALGDGTEKTRELDPKEIQTLASVDRYGFFSIPSHDRLILLTSAPLLRRLYVTPAGPPNALTNAKSLQALPPIPLPPRETSRIAKWTRMLQPLTRDQGGNVENWCIKPSKESKFRPRTYKGIPDRWRAAAWDLSMSRFAKLDRRQMAVLGNEYRDALDKPSSFDIQIDLDVPRTISGHIMFRTRYGAGQRSLFHVLHCFSLRCTQCGYVQGMGPIAATLLCYFEPERVYASLVRLHDAYSMHTIFSPGFPGLLEAIYVQERITEQMMPDVYAAFRKHMISTTSYATKWYITLFANSVPFQTQLRLWDAFLLEGYDVFVAVAVAIVWVYRDQITAISASFETVLSLLSSFFVPEDENTLLSWIEKTLGDKKLRTSMLQWREDWKGLVASGKDGAALL